MATLPVPTAEPTNQSFIRDLRAVADFYEARPELPPPTNGYSWDPAEFTAFLHVSPREFAEIAVSLDAPLTVSSSKFASLKREFGLITVIYKQSAETACVSKEVATAPVYEWSLDGGAQ